MWRKTKHVAAVFLSEQTLVPKEGMSQKNVCVSVRPQTDVFETQRRYQRRGPDMTLTVISSTIHRHLSPSCTHCTPANTLSLTPHLLPQRQDVNVSVPPQQFSF